MKKKEELTEQEYEKLLDKKIRQYNRKQTIKKILLIMLIVIGLFGGYKSLFSADVNTAFEESENQTFVRTYSGTYFKYPKEQEDIDYLKTFSLENWISNYDQKVVFSELTEIEIYKVKEIDKLKNIYDYYLYGQLTSKKETENEIKNKVYFKVTVAKQDKQYLVIRPIQFTSVDIDSIDEEIKEQYNYEIIKGTESVKGEKLQELENTLKLFITTYNENPVQARLLAQDNSIVENLDSNTVLSLKSITSATEDDKTIYVELVMEEKYMEVYKVDKKYHFEIDKEKNKIKKMEVY